MCVMGLKEDFSGSRWEPGETVLINNAAVSEGATQSPHTTRPFWNESKEDSKSSIRCNCSFIFNMLMVCMFCIVEHLRSHEYKYV